MSTNILDSVLDQYEKNKQATSGNKPKMSQEDLFKRYFNPVLQKGEKTKEFRVRILPTKDGTTPFKEAKFHEIQVDGKYPKLYDPAQDGERSPLNEVKEGLEMSGVESDKILARDYRSKKFYIVKLIDRDHEEDGPKFYRFKHNGKGDGVLDKIIPIWKNKGDITDVEQGRDLIITATLAKSGNGKDYTTVSSIIPEDKGPLHTDPAKIEEWLNHDLTWRDVYSKKPVEYLEMIAKGETPKWSSDAKKWVSNSTEETSIGRPSADIDDPQEADEVDSDLPF